MQLREADARRALHQACGLDRFGWNADRFAAGRGAVVLPIVLSELLRDESPLARQVLLDALAGL